MTKTDKERMEWRKRHKENIHDMYRSPNILRVIKLRKLKWAGHIALGREEKRVQRQSKKKAKLINLNLLLYLLHNQTCLLQSTPLYC